MPALGKELPRGNRGMLQCFGGLKPWWCLLACSAWILCPEGKLCLVHQPRDASSQSGTNVHAKNACFSNHVPVLVFLESKAFKRQGLSTQCRIVYWWSHSWTSSGYVSSMLLQWLPMHSGLFSKVFLSSSSLFPHGNFYITRGVLMIFSWTGEIGDWHLTEISLIFFFFFFIKTP